MKFKAYSYTRFSSGKQAKGISKIRQQESPFVLDFIKRHGLHVVQQMVDAGVSGFKGKNFSHTAALGKFFEAIRQGKIDKGSILIIENCDRFSRANITECITHFIEIIKAGVSIGIVSMNIIIDLDRLNSDPMVWHYVSNEFLRARSESKRKSELSKANIANKLERAKRGEKIYFGGLAPSWIKGVEDGEWIVEERIDKTIQRVFEMYLEGKSCSAIAKTLNQENVKSIRETLWFNTTVKHILANRAVIGHCKVGDFESDSYYPRLVSDGDFYTVQTKLARNATNRGGSRNNKVPNIFKGLLSCAKCGGLIAVRHPIVAGHCYHYMGCKFSHFRCCTDKQNWKMDEFEERFFFLVLEKNPDEFLEKPKTKTEKETPLARLNGELQKVTFAIGQATQLLGELPMEEIRKRLSELEAERLKLKLNIQKELTKQAATEANPSTVQKFKEMFSADNEEEWVANAEEILTKLKDDKIRAGLRNILPSLVERIQIDFSGWKYTVTFTNGVKKTMVFDA